MALIQCDFFSEQLGMSCSMNVILPQNTTRQIGMQCNSHSGRHPTLWLLHGLSDDHTIWGRRTNIERYVASLGIAVVMPAVHRSFYTDIDTGSKYWQFISDELPAIARSFFPLSDKREDNFVAGLSMGGFGALKLALNHPENYIAAASLSGALDPLGFIDESEEHSKEFLPVFGPKGSIQRQRSDLVDLSTKLKKSQAPCPNLYMACGDEDFLFDVNNHFAHHLKEISYDHIYEVDPGYSHSWDYWDMAIQRVLQWLPIAKVSL